MQNNQAVTSEIKRKNVNPWVKTFGSLDWIYIIGILGSFIAIALTYDAFTGEKEDGTLRLLLSNNVPRYKLLIGKFLGAFLALFIPLVIGQLVSLIILNVSGSINLTMYEYQKIAGIVVLSWMYLTVFIFIGLFVSSLTHNSSSSLIILLFIWIVSTVIIPGSSSIFARNIYKLPESDEIDKQVWSLQTEATNENLSTIEKAKIQYERHRLIGEIRDEYRNKKFAQVEIARAFTRISPMGTLTYGTEAFAGVGLVRQKHLINQMLAYKNRLGEFILSEERRLSDDPKGILFSSTLPRKAFNTDAIPVFQEQRMTICEGFGNALLDMAILILYGFVFFTGAYVSFNRYDVR
ncbi:ABC transporter permease [Candidatus Latescibacterota bacterium]